MDDLISQYLGGSGPRFLKTETTEKALKMNKVEFNTDAFADRFREIRVARGYSLTDLLERVGQVSDYNSISVSEIEDIEGSVGTSSIDVEELLIFATALGVSPETFYSDEPLSFAPEKEEENDFSLTDMMEQLGIDGFEAQLALDPLDFLKNMSLKIAFDKDANAVTFHAFDENEHNVAALVIRVPTPQGLEGMIKAAA